MKLLIIARPFVFHGGVERATAGLVGALLEHGYDVHLLTPRGQYAVPGVTQHVLTLPRLPAPARALAFAAVARLAVARGTSWNGTGPTTLTCGRSAQRRAIAPPGSAPTSASITSGPRRPTASTRSSTPL